MEIDPQDTRNIARNWREYLRDTRDYITIARWVLREFVSVEGLYWTRRMMAALALSTIALTVFMGLTKTLSDGLLKHNARLVWLGFGGMIISQLLHILFSLWQGRCRERVASDNIGRLNKRINELFYEKSMGQHLLESRYLNASTIERGKSRIEGLESLILFQAVPVMLMLVTSYVGLWIIKPAAPPAIFMTLILGWYLGFTVYMNRHIAEKCTPLDKRYRRAYRHRHERLEKIERVKTNAKEEEEILEQDKTFRDIAGQDLSFWLWAHNRFTVRGLVNRMTFLFGVVGYTAWRIWMGDWTMADLMPLWLWGVRVSDNLWQIGDIEHQINWNLPPIRTAMQVLSMPPDVTDKPDAIDLAGTSTVAIRFENVSFAYQKKLKLSVAAEEEGMLEEPEALSPVLRNVSFSITPGEKVALIGKSGAGKTTIMRLVQRYMDPTEGRILVNSCDFRDVKLSSLRRLSGYIPQEPQIYDGTIRDNILYGLSAKERAEVGEEEIWHLVRELQINFEGRLKKGLDTLVGRYGIELSGGEKQRLSVGTAAMKKPMFMVIDEATSSLDAATEQAVQRGLKNMLGPNVSALIIAHRLNTVRHVCDTFVSLRSTGVCQNGEPQVEAIGSSFEELYELSPTFRELADKQEVAMCSRYREHEVIS